MSILNTKSTVNTDSRAKPIIIAGPCAAESYDMLRESCSLLVSLRDELDFELVFKASFDKANRNAMGSPRGAGFEQTAKWFGDLKAEFQIATITDVHETPQVAKVAEFVDVLQIPAFLCRQTDLVVAAARTGKIVNIKKGQFMSPAGMAAIVEKAGENLAYGTKSEKIWVTERGTTFGYGDLIVDPRSYKAMSDSCQVPVIFDCTHAVQRPGGGADSRTSSGTRWNVPTLARGAAASGYLDGFFLEVHPDPKQAISDRDTQLNFEQAGKLLRQIVPLLKSMKTAAAIDSLFEA